MAIKKRCRKIGGPGNKQKLVTSNGKIRYYTNISGESSSAGVDKMCRNAENIPLP
jgi:hypothetical protein